MASQAAKDLPELFQKLSELLTSSDEVICPLLEDILKLCLQDVTSENADIIISNALNEKFGILQFLRSISSKQALRRSTSDSLDFIQSLIKKFRGKIKEHVNDIKLICMQVYAITQVADLKCRALSTYAELLKCGELGSCCGGLVDDAKRLVSDLSKSDTQIKPTVKREIYILLGMFCSTSPSSMTEMSDNLAEIISSTLKHQMTRSKAPETAIVSGCFISLCHLLGPFDRSAYPEQVSNMFNCMAKAIDPSIKTTRYDIPKSALDLLAKHGEQFRPQFLQSYKDIYSRLVKFSMMNNPEVKKAAIAAAETFLRQVGAELADPMDDSLTEDLRRDIFNYFLKDFMSLMRSTSSNLRSVSQAIRSYGYFAAAFKKFQGEREVRDMLTILLEKCLQVCTTEDETSDSKAAFLPSFLQSLASIIKHIDMVDDSIGEPLRGIFSLTLNFYPTLTGPLHISCTSSIIQFIYSVCSMEQRPVKLLSDLVYQLLIHTCMHSPVIEGESAPTFAEDGNKRLSYKDYTHLWTDLLSPRKYLSVIGVVGISELEICVYGEIMKSVLRVCNKLDLSITTLSASEGNSDGMQEVDGTGLASEPVKIKDYQILINLTDFVKAVLEEVKTELFNDWTFTFCHAIVKQSSEKPSISSFYKLLTSAMVICSTNDYFESTSAGIEDDSELMDILGGSSNAASSMTHRLISRYQEKVVTCMKQYKDDLLISCLKFLFSLPASIIKCNPDTTSEALRIGLSLGLSYPPLIKQCLKTLKLLFSSLNKDDLVEQLRILLPYFDKFLQSSERAEDRDVEEISRKVLKNKQRLKLPPALLRLANEKTFSGRTEIQKLKSEVLTFLGGLGGECNQYVISNDRRELAKLAVSWDTKSHLRFDVPFRETKADIYLDKFLPHTCELALSSSNRQTKVAACELLHSLVILLLGRVTTQGEYAAKNPTDKIYTKLFPVLLDLAVDMEQVAKQLFEPLVLQLIHWFTRYPKLKETALLLDTLMTGVETVNNSALREFSAVCIAEFLRWSIKQTSVQQQRKNPENVKQLLRRMFSMARHPSSGKRRGACFVYNHIYTILREEESLVDKFTMEILVCFVDCLACAHADDPSLETYKAAKQCLSHVERILKAKAHLFLQPSKDRRTPTGWVNCTLKDAVLWLLSQVGRHETECRHACMELVSNLTPSLSSDINSRHKLIQHVISKQGVPYIIDRCDAVPTTKDGKPGILQMPSPFKADVSPSVKCCLRWFDKLLACLDAYCWFIGNDLLSANQLLTGKAGIFPVLSHFITDVSMQSLSDVTSQQASKIAYTPTETDEYNRSKCTAMVRMFDFITVIMSKDKKILLSNNLVNTDFWHLLGICILDPVQVGFNMADIVILENLPELLKQLIQTTTRFLDTADLQVFYDVMRDLLNTGEGKYNLCQISESLELYPDEESHLFSTHVASGYQLLSDVDVLVKSLPAGISAHDLSLKLSNAVFKASRAKTTEPTTMHLLEVMYNLALSIGLADNSVMDMLFSETGLTLYSYVETVLLKYITSRGASLIPAIMRKAGHSPHKTSSYIVGLLDYCKEATTISARQKQLMVSTVLDEWTLLDSWWNGSSANAVTVSQCIVMLRKSILIGSNMEKHRNYGEIIRFFVHLLNSPHAEHSQRCDLLDILPTFLIGTVQQTKDTGSCVQKYVNDRFPLSSSELPIDSSGYHDYMTALCKILEAMVIGSDLELFKIVLGVICREETHVQEGVIQEYIRRFSIRLRKLQPGKQLEALSMSFTMFKDRAMYGNQTIRVAALSRVCLPMLRRFDKITIMEFFKLTLKDIQRLLTAKESKGQPDAYMVTIRDKICCYTLVELMYNSLLKDEVFSQGSSLAHLWIADDPTAKAKPDSWKNMTKELISLSKDCKNEDMRGETVHLEWRRKLHCAAYNALIAIISNTQVDPRFYKSFLFAGDAVKGCTPLENICPQTPYTFEVELSNLPVRTKKLVSVRHLNDDDGETADTVAYMQSAVESSLTEDLSKYDFSYSQSISSSKQRREEKEQEQLELLYPDNETVQPTSTNISQGFVELESDSLNEHECMAQFTSLLQHMLTNNITPSASDELDDLPGWMGWLKDKLDAVGVPVNVKHFIARIILNNEKVFKPFAQLLLPSLVKYVTSCCEELHYFCIDVVVMVILWCDNVTPQKEAEGRSMLNSLIGFIISKAHHERKGIFKNNLDLIKTCLERWKSFVKINSGTIYDFLKSADDKRVLTGVQILGVVIANKIDSYNPASCDVGKQEFYKSLGKGMMNRLLSVYSSASEVIGLVFNFLSTHGDDNSKQFCAQYEGFIEKGLLSMPANLLGKFIVCLYSIHLHYQPFSDRFMSKVLFEIQRLHGDMKQKGLEIIAGRIAYTEQPYTQLCNINFSTLLAHRNTHIMQSCLKIFHNVLEKLTAEQTDAWLSLVANCQSNGDESCRRQAHAIFISVYNKYSGSNRASRLSADDDITDRTAEEKLFYSSQENLLLALADPSQHNRLIVQNFWSSETTMSQDILARLQAILEQMYSPGTETNFLSYATNLILELTSRSSDFDRPIFNTPLSDCKFEAYAVNSTWSQRFSTLAPMFADGTMSQSVGSLGAGLLRGTQATQQFTATLDPADSREKTYNWLTQSSLDASIVDSTTTSTSTSSLLFAVGSKTSKVSGKSKPIAKRTQKLQDEVDGRINAAESNPELSALRRRFIKDQESSRIYFAKRESRRKRQEQERRVLSKQQRENQVTLYRQYRIGDLPDIQIKYSAIITPLQALAQKDSTTARMLFLEVSQAILSEVDDTNETSKAVVLLVEKILGSSTQYHPPLIACFMELLVKLSAATDPSFSPTIIADCSIQCKQQPVGVVTLEKRLIPKNSTAGSRESKRVKTARDAEKVDDPQSWVDLARLYKSMGHYDIVRSIISHHINVHEHTRQALEYESKYRYEQACDLYENMLNEEQSRVEEMQELSLIDDGRLHCMEQLTKWGDMESTLMANLDDNWVNIWSDSSKDYYLRALMKCQTKKLMVGGGRTDFLTFINESCKVSERRNLLEVNYCDHLAIIYMASKDFGRAQHYYQLATDRFLYDWSTIGQLMTNARSHNMLSLQKLTEMGEFLELIRGNPDIPAACGLVTRWADRSPGHLADSSTWDDVITNRIFYMNMLDSVLETDLFNQQKLSMKLTQAGHATDGGNIGLALNILRSIRSDIDEDTVGVELKLRFSAAGVQIKQRMANSPDITLSERIKHTSAAIRALGQYSDGEVDRAATPKDPLYYQWYSLKNKTWSCLLSGVLESSKEDIEECQKELLSLAGCSSFSQITSSLSEKGMKCIKKSISTEVDTQITSAHMDMVMFADHLLRHNEEAGTSVISKKIVADLTTHMITSCSKALELGCENALGWVPRLLQLLEIYPDTVDIFISKTKNVACWTFIGWISQMVAMLDSKHGTAVHHIITDIADSYPMALVYPVKISLDQYTPTKDSTTSQFILRLREKLSSYTLVDKIITALEQLSQPEALFKDWVEMEMGDMFTQGKLDIKVVETSYKQIRQIIFDEGTTSADGALYDDEFVDANKYKKEFAKAFSAKLDALAGKRGEKIVGMSAKGFKETFFKLAQDMKNTVDKTLRPPGLLKEYSTWLTRFNGELVEQQIEIPGQYGKTNRKPLPEHHVTIAGFDETVMVMKSIRKPKRVVIRGNDEREYKFLVKGGEDLRLDQRVQTVFVSMNKMMTNNSSCRQLSLTTYSVIPMNTRLGLIEWMEDMSTLKEVLMSSRTVSEQHKYDHVCSDYSKRYSTDPKKYQDCYSSLSSTACADWFTKLQDRVAPHILRKYLHSLSTSIESYYVLREQCITSHAVLSVCQYLLGIGDRHLSNFMVDTHTASIVGIDFGHAFGTATTLLPVPELVPFRLTRQFTELMEPYGTHSLFERTMVSVLRVMRENRRQLLNLLDIFIKEPSLDWMENAKKQSKRAEFSNELSNTFDEHENWYPKEKVKFAELKLLGAHSRYVTSEEFKLNSYMKKFVDRGQKHIVPDQSVNKELRLSVEEQVQALIDHARDPNLLGRIFIGWEPYV